MTRRTFSVSAWTVVEAVRNLMLNDEPERAFDALSNGLVGDESAEIARAVCDGTMTLVNATRDELKAVDEDPAIRADYQEKLRALYAGRVRVNDAWYTPIAYAARCRGLDSAPADVQKWGRLVTQHYCLLNEIVLGDVIFTPCEPPPSWHPYAETPALAVQQAEACRTLKERGRRDSVDKQLHDMRKRVATTDHKGLVELSYAMQDFLNAEEDAREAAELTDIGARVRVAAGDDTFPMTLLDGSVVQVPRAPFEQWALRRTALRHLAAPWSPVAYPGLKMQNDCPYHTDWVLGAGLSLDDAYGSHEQSLYIAASYTAAHELQERLGNFSATVIVDAGARSGIVGKTVAVVPNLSVKYEGALKCTAIITEVGGALAHLAIVGREQGITIMRVPDAMTRYPKGVRVHLYPTTGEVIASTYKPTPGDDDYGDDE